MRKLALAVLGVFVLSAPSAHAARKAERRTLPNGIPASAAAPAAQPAVDPALEAAVDRLRAALDAPGPTIARQRGGARGAAQSGYLARSASGYVTTFVAPPGRAYAVARPGGDTGPDGLALAFLRENRVALGWTKKGATLRAAKSVKREGRSFVRFEQRFAGLPVYGASAVVQVEPDGGVAFALVDIAHDDAELHAAGFATAPSVAAGSAASTALGALPAGSRGSLVADDPELMIFEPSVVGSAGPSRLVWTTRVRNPEGDVNQVVLVDAVSGEVAFTYSDVKHAKNRQIYDANNVSGSLGTLARSEGGAATGIADVDLAYQYFGDTYDFYFTRFGRDSYDAAGAALVARVRYCETGYTCPYRERLLERHRDAVRPGLRRRRRRGGPRAHPRGDGARVEPHLLGRVRGDQRVPVRHLRRDHGPGELRRHRHPGRALADGRGRAGRRHPQHVRPDALRGPRPALQRELVHGRGGQPGRPLQLRRREQARVPPLRRRPPSTARPWPARGPPRSRGSSTRRT